MADGTTIQVMTADKRVVVGQKIQKLANEYGADYTNMTEYSYNKYIVSDAVHPWNEGWVRINEKVAESLISKIKNKISLKVYSLYVYIHGCAVCVLAVWEHAQQSGIYIC